MLEPTAPDTVGLPRHLRGPARRQGADGQPAEFQVPHDPRHPQGPAPRPGAGDPPGECEAPHHPRHPRAVDRATSLGVRFEVRLLTGKVGRALVVAQGRALAALLASLGEAEVGQGEEVSP